MRPTTSYVASIALLLALPLACTDLSNGPTPPLRDGDRPVHLLDDTWGIIVGESGPAFLVAPVLRATPLAAPVSWSFTAGPEGTTSTNAATGLTVVVPAGALAAPVTITVTALAGAATAYRFEPHGLQFGTPVDLHQSLSGLVVNDKHLRGAYFPDDLPAIDPVTGLTIVTELSPTKLDKKSGVVRIKIKHFSGYIYASGRTGSEDGETAGGY